MSILSTTNVGKFDSWNAFKREHAHPEGWGEFKDTIVQAIAVKGNDVDLNWIDTSKILDMSYLFYGTNFNGDISKWDVSNVENMSCMFFSAKFNGDLSKWNVRNVKDMDLMFKNCPLEKNPPKWYKRKVKIG